MSVLDGDRFVPASRDRLGAGAAGTPGDPVTAAFPAPDPV